MAAEPDPQVAPGPAPAATSDPNPAVTPDPCAAVARVAVLAPVPSAFDYAIPEDLSLRRGDRVAVPFGPRVRVAIVLAVLSGLEPAESPRALKKIIAHLAPAPCLPEGLLGLLEWAARYYLCPLGEALATALPAAMRRPEDAPVPTQQVWRLAEFGGVVDAGTNDAGFAHAHGDHQVGGHVQPDAQRDSQVQSGCHGQSASHDHVAGDGHHGQKAKAKKNDPTPRPKGPRQIALMARLAKGPLSEHALDEFDFDARAALRRLVRRGWVVSACVPDSAGPLTVTLPAAGGPRSELRPQQARAVTEISQDFGQFRVTLLEGVTGSGKTEVYLALLEACVAAGGQGLVLVPEIGLAHTLAERFRARFGAHFACYHSGLGESERLRTWHAIANGQLRVVLGTRSAVWLPCADLRLLVVDEEHDESFKQSDGFRYSGRDIAIARGQRSGIPVVLGSATPACETLANVERGRFAHLRLTERALASQPNAVELVDLRAERPEHGVGVRLQAAIAETLARGEQALIFVNRRGFAPTVLCRSCGTPIECRDCAAPMVYYRRQNRMQCHHCGATRPLKAPCSCGEAFEPVSLGAGTERVYDYLAAQFPDANVARIDRDVVRSSQRREDVFEGLASGRIHIAVGTRMIAKGHHFPGVTLVGVIDADARLFSTDFRAPERLAQGLEQVAGRAGRESRPGRVLVQTRNPEHPLFNELFTAGYPAAVRSIMLRRRAARLPPYSMLVLVRADAPEEVEAMRFLAAVETALVQAFPLIDGTSAVHAIGPFPAPLVRKAGTYRAQLLIEVSREAGLLQRLARIEDCVRAVKAQRALRWAIDVDPLEMG